MRISIIQSESVLSVPIPVFVRPVLTIALLACPNFLWTAFLALTSACLLDFTLLHLQYSGCRSQPLDCPLTTICFPSIAQSVVFWI
ncbi:hypothetical protein GJAV_G00160320 [Gymnothorax javanicus]|nr:hypothetical protein GJAV_G00160320 [Gymnothorax javanicus]